jgi:hypothetical protein
LNPAWYDLTDTLSDIHPFPSLDPCSESDIEVLKHIPAAIDILVFRLSLLASLGIVLFPRPGWRVGLV